MSYIKIELNRAFINKMFLISLVLSFLIVILQVVQDALPYANELYLYPDQYPPSIYNSCLGLSVSVWNAIFYLIFPVLSAMPYADSFLSDKKSGYIKNIYTRTNKKNYLIAKFISVFLSGGMVVLLPLLLNILLVALCVPAVIPDASTGFFPIFSNFTGAEVYYTNPLLYVLLYALLMFFVSGCFACTSLLFSFFVKYKYVVLMSPFLLFMAISCISTLLSLNNPLNISQWIIPSQQFQTLNLSVAIIEMLAILFLTYIIYFLKGTHDDTI